ncbi:TlpA family protein disulfide reductase [Dyella solisilvae]|uniref:TlpA family protein disulfide reductase n=1 Tax=Dyella solisilvae TaxID=1920168 RepID=A0A370K5G7_9GAMM|nr:TlpA disulfide reductase family protein [Dyella solisilvae]RDI97891.1 TlpA family protein disulfide reductase [Dyella solisilvae]
MKQTIRIALAVAALALATLCQAHPDTGDIPPDFLGHDRHGADVRVSGFHGKVVIVSFWASWCRYCLKEMPILAAIQKKVGSDQLQVVGVDHDDDMDLFRKTRYRWKDLDVILTYEPSDNSISKPYGIKGLPYMVMIGRDGRIAHIHVGYGEDELDGILAELQDLLNAPAPAPSTATAPSGA